MSTEEGAYRGHVIVLPFHGQGHMNPMLQFCKRLASKGIKITLATTVSTVKNLTNLDGSIGLEPIFDDTNDLGMRGAGGIQGFLERFQEGALRNLVGVVRKHEGTQYPIKCLVYDADLSRSLEVARELGILAAGFFTQSCAAIASYMQMHKEMTSSDGSSVGSGGAPAIALPPVGREWDGRSKEGRFPPFLRSILEHVSDIDKADWILFNSFDKLEEEVVKDLSQRLSIRTVGPTLPSVFLDKRLKDDKNYGFNIFKPDEDSCMNWLNTQESGSVVYVSFGSGASLSVAQMAELGWGLRQSNFKFLWVVRATEKGKLPEVFIEETAEQGLVVTWSPQLQVLTHPAVGCFITHSGWNSTLEGLSLGVPMVAMPQFLDQFSNAKLVEEVWRVGLRPKGEDEKSIVKREEIERCIREVMEGETNQGMKKNVRKWSELAKEAVDVGGSSEKNIEEIVARIVSR